MTQRAIEECNLSDFDIKAKLECVSFLNESSQYEWSFILKRINDNTDDNINVFISERANLTNPNVPNHKKQTSGILFITSNELIKTNEKFYMLDLYFFKDELDNLVSFKYVGPEPVKIAENKEHDIKSYLKSSLDIIGEINTKFTFEKFDLLESSIKSSLSLIDGNSYRDVEKHASHNSTNVIKFYVYIFKYLNSVRDINYKCNIDTNVLISYYDFKVLKGRISEIIKSSKDKIINLSFTSTNNILFGDIRTSETSMTSEIECKSNDSIECVINDDEIKIISEISNRIILVVDDSFLSIKLLTRQICNILLGKSMPPLSPLIKDWDKHGIMIVPVDDYTFVLAANGIYGRDIALMKRCEYIFSDIEMPKMNGVQFIKELILNGINSKVIINTSLSYDSFAELEEIEGFQGRYIQKGSTLEEISNVIHS